MAVGFIKRPNTMLRAHLRSSEAFITMIMNCTGTASGMMYSVPWQTQAVDGAFNFHYDGLSTTTRNSAGQRKTEIRNGLDQLVAVVDHLVAV